MLLKVYSVYDVKAETYGRPMCMVNVGVAVRGFSDEVKDVKSSLNKHPEDFRLFELGTFDDLSGMFESYKQPKLVCTATEFAVDNKVE